MARRRGNRKIDFVHWTYGSFTFLATQAGIAAVNVFPAAHDPETLLRIRGNVLGFIDGASAPAKHISVGVGLIVVPEGTGTTALWSPIQDGDAPWLWVTYFELAYEEMVTDVIAAQVAMAYRESIDNKAMRILRNSEIQCVMENATINGAAAANVTGSFRALAGK